MNKSISVILCAAAVSINIMYGQIDSENDKPRIPKTYKEVLAIQIKDIEKTHCVTSSDGKGVSLLSFGGTCDNGYFKGYVMPGGIDCQRTDGKTSSFSARYLLEGTDFAGDSCRIFIENNADGNSNISKPQIITDSRALSFLNDSDLICVLDNTGPFTIRIYAEQSAGDNGKIMIPGPHGLLASVLRDDCIRGNTFGKLYPPLDPPEAVDLGGGKFLGREFIKTAFSLPIYETAEKYHDPACIIHGTVGRVVPYTYSLRFHDIRPGSEYHELSGYDHGFAPQPQTSVDIATDYLFRTLSK